VEGASAGKGWGLVQKGKQIGDIPVGEGCMSIKYDEEECEINYL